MKTEQQNGPHPARTSAHTLSSLARVGAAVSAADQIPKAPLHEVRQKGSCRFAPYYKAQWYNKKLLAWRDLKTQFATEEAARGAFKKGQWRVMIVTMEGRHVL